MILDDTNTIGALAFLFFMIYLATDPRDLSLLAIPAYFGGMLVAHWLTENGFQDTYIYTTWIVIYSLVMIYLIIASIRLGIKNVVYIKEKIKKHRALRK
ncbi:hypothetical protein [Bacillus cereus group sp. BfR-BA-01380]|uniref:hypothetical protein n=1 Tax=Bacillus cereus group sp. BfR-BA-01380 TaxID=2920324 RepID=UPI001F5A6774|nr:hypothetical protein [Bacillus cereus group sp. BfR-BA-01380]